MAIDDVAIGVQAKGVQAVSETQVSKLCPSGVQAIGALLSLRSPSHRCHSVIQTALAALKVNVVQATGTTKVHRRSDILFDNTENQHQRKPGTYEHCNPTEIEPF